MWSTRPRGTWLYVGLDGGAHLRLHVGMTGHLTTVTDVARRSLGPDALDPRTPAAEVSRDEARRLHRQLRRVLEPRHRR